MGAILTAFEGKHPESFQLSKEAAELFPDGVTHASRRLSPFPVYMDRGKGPRKWDVDGNEYVDYRTGHGSMILGQANPAVVSAVQNQIAKGSHLSSGTRLEVAWGQTVKRLVPSVEKLRFVSSGTEALMMAFKIARSFTRKEKIVKFAGAFHGWSDPAYVTDPETDAKYGIPKGTSESMIVLPAHDLEALEQTLASRKDIAAVVFQGNDIATPEYIHGLAETTERHGVLLIFDEVVSGFRWSRAGCQGRYGVRPDLSCFAKILAGGLPGGCVAGRADLLDTIGEDGIRHPGTFNANPVSAAAGTTALGIVEKEPIVETAEMRAEQLRAQINDVLAKMEIPGGAYGVASIVMVSLGTPVDTSNPYARPANTEMGGRPIASETLDLLHLALINEGVWSHPASFILSATHTDKEIDETAKAYEAALAAVRAEGKI